MINNKEDMLLLKNTLIAARKIALKYYKQPLKHWIKNDASPVTEADIRVNEFLEKILLEARPTYGWISEESPNNSLAQKAEINFIVDPIDGTKGFLQHDAQWCIGVAIEKNNEIVAAAIICPALDELYYGAIGEGIYFNEQPFSAVVNKVNNENLIVALPKKLLHKIKHDKLENTELYSYVPSLLYKIILCARGIIDVVIIYPTCKVWDLAAGNLFLKAMDGILVDSNNEAVVYSKLGNYNKYLFACKNNSCFNKIKNNYIGE